MSEPLFYPEKGLFYWVRDPGKAYRCLQFRTQNNIYRHYRFTTWSNPRSKAPFTPNGVYQIDLEVWIEYLHDRNILRVKPKGLMTEYWKDQRDFFSRRAAYYDTFGFE